MVGPQRSESLCDVKTNLVQFVAFPDLVCLQERKILGGLEPAAGQLFIARHQRLFLFLLIGGGPCTRAYLAQRSRPARLTAHRALSYSNRLRS